MLLSLPTLTLILGCAITQNRVECNDREIFGYATFQKIEDKTAYFTFAVDDASGNKKKYGELFEIVAPFGVKAGKEYPSLLKTNCDQHNLIIIREIGSSCKIK